MKTWIRLYTNLPANRKAQALSADLFKFWVNCLAMAGRHDDGLLPSTADIAWELRIKLGRVTTWLNQLMERGLIDGVTAGYRPHNWAKRQFEESSSAERVRRFRERSGNVTRNDGVTDVTRYSRARSESESESESEKKETGNTDVSPSTSTSDSTKESFSLESCNGCDDDERDVSEARARKLKITAAGDTLCPSCGEMRALYVRQNPLTPATPKAPSGETFSENTKGNTDIPFVDLQAPHRGVPLPSAGSGGEIPATIPVAQRAEQPAVAGSTWGTLAPRQGYICDNCGQIASIWHQCASGSVAHRLEQPKPASKALPGGDARANGKEPGSTPGGATPEQWREWWDRWTRAKGNEHEEAACRMFLSVVNAENYAAVIDCTLSYLHSERGAGGGGYRPDNFLQAQARSGFTVYWRAKAKRVDSAGEVLQRMAREMEAGTFVSAFGGAK